MPRFSSLYAAVLCTTLSGLASSAASAAAPVAAKGPVAAELARWHGTAQRVTIMRDTWGVPHVYGKTDADAVFGLMYAQAEDDFNRVEQNYINGMGRLAEAEGASKIYLDLRMKLFINPDSLKAQYAASPAWLKKLMNAYADGLNYYLYTHPDVKPKVITHFEPWMALSFSEGSIGGDIESVNLTELENMYGKLATPLPPVADAGGLDPEPSGSNGFAISPSITKNGHALFMINPHTTFYFRPEVQVSSGEGLNAYGAVTWGQFFVYQGFNDRIGWMHTSGGGNVIDEYLETVSQKDGAWFYQYGDKELPLKPVTITVPYKQGDTMAHKVFTVYYSKHGPIVRQADGKWIAVQMMNSPLKALIQSYSRTKARNYAEFYKVMELRTNSSNNTVYADADGNIAYFHGNFIPRRDPSFDWKKPVDGSNPATDWQGLHEVKETITLFNPKNGWIQNTNAWPFKAAGPYSPRQQDYPSYMSEQGENYRGIHAVRVLENKKDFTLDSLIAAAYDPELPAFEPLIGKLLAAYDALGASDPLRTKLAPQIEVLRHWDFRTGLTSVPTSLAIFYGQDLADSFGKTARGEGVAVIDYIVSDTVTPLQRLQALDHAATKLEQDFGTWQTPWGEINRFQRVTDDDAQPYDDSKPSLPIPYTSSTWGALAAFGMTSKPPTKRIYGERGNSFVAFVEFGPRIRAKSVLAGGESGDPKSKHFNDQAEMYSKGEFKDVLFYKEDVEKHLERKYHPGQ